jgi:hypothetical protein
LPALRVNELDGHPNVLAHELTARALTEHFHAEFLGRPSRSERALDLYS